MSFHYHGSTLVFTLVTIVVTLFGLVYSTMVHICKFSGEVACPKGKAWAFGSSSHYKCSASVEHFTHSSFTESLHNRLPLFVFVLGALQLSFSVIALGLEQVLDLSCN